MARAKPDSTAFRAIPLSSLFADPLLREAFRRAEDDTGTALTVSYYASVDDDGGGCDHWIRKFEVDDLLSPHRGTPLQLPLIFLVVQNIRTALQSLSAGSCAERSVHLPSDR
jgi:hypothetical protein